jgi:hypothetical protein
MIPCSDQLAREPDFKRRDILKKPKATIHIIALLIATMFFSSIARGQFVAAQEFKKKRGAINLSLGYAESTDFEKGNFGLLKSVGWNLLSGWLSAGVNFGIIKNEIMLMGNVSLIVPLDRIEPFATAVYGFILETFSAVSNYGGGLRVRLGKKIGIIAEYRKLDFTQKRFRGGEKTKVKVDYFGAGIFYYF